MESWKLTIDKIERKRIPVIDFIRVISTMYLVLYHYVCAFNTIPFPKIVKPAASLGYIGVEVFFMLSGFCIALNYRNTKETFPAYIYRRVSPWYVSYVLAIFMNLLLQFAVDKNISSGGGIPSRQAIDISVFIYQFAPCA